MDTSQAAPVKKKGLKKLWAKVKASIKSDSSRTQRNSAAGPSTTTTRAEEPTPTPKPDIAIPTEQTTTITEPTTTTRHEPTLVKGQDTTAQTIDVIEVDDDEQQEEISLPQTYTASRSTADKARFDRARAIFEKYNLTLEQSDWQAQSKAKALRVEKKPRMRVRYTCDSCNATFGRDRTCSKCAHTRCANCTRYPAKRTGERTRKRTEKIEAVPSELTDMPTTGACHDCKTEFTIGQPDCANCGHKICETCLKETIMAYPATSPPLPRTAALADA